MSQLSLEDVTKIARLARIAITDDEASNYLSQLNNIFELIEQMQSIDTSSVEPMAHAQDVYLRLREDAVTESDKHEAFQAVAPQTEAGLYLVPKVIE